MILESKRLKFHASVLRTTTRAGALYAALIVTLALAGLGVASRSVSASSAMSDAAAQAGGGLDGCSSNSGKALYDCVAGVLEKMSAATSADNVPETRRAINTAAAGLRAATTKAQAVSAISQCRSVIANALRQVRAAGNTYVRGWGGGAGGGAGLSAVSNIIARAVRLIQTKG